MPSIFSGGMTCYQVYDNNTGTHDSVSTFSQDSHLPTLLTLLEAKKCDGQPSVKEQYGGQRGRDQHKGWRQEKDEET